MYHNTIPFTKILDWDVWVEEFKNKLRNVKSKDEQLIFAFETLPKWKNYIDAICKKEIPIMEVPKVADDDMQGISEVCSIFEKMNSTGVRLTVFDLLAARLYKYRNKNNKRISLHELWEKAIEKNALLKEFSNSEPDLYGVFALRFIALKREQEVKGKTIINLDPENFEDDWNLAVDYLERALQRIRETAQGGFGAISSRWMPYSTMVPVLAALLWKVHEDKLDHRSLKYIQKWYWASVFLERYAGAVETTTKRDYDDLITIFSKKSFVPVVFAEVDRDIINNPRFSLKDVDRINSIYKGVMNLIALEGAKDFRKDESIKLSFLDDHHIFPQAHLKNIKDDWGNPKYSKNKINCILNRTLISTETNKDISSSKPSEYIRKIIPSAEKESILRSHFINKDAIEKMEMESDTFEGFIEDRENEILSSLKGRLSMISSDQDFLH